MKVYSVADHIISPLGFGTSQNYKALKHSRSGIREIASGRLSSERFFGADIARDEVEARFNFADPDAFSFLEKLFILSLRAILLTMPGINKRRLLLIVSTTKGNIDLLGKKTEENINGKRLELASLAKAVNEYFQIPNEPLVVSNACISGVSAIITGKKLIRMGMYDHVLVTGGDILSEFTLSGFHCLKAISDEPCRPYDAARKGITLGEACGSVLLSNDPGLCNDQQAFSIIRGGGQANDANHISGPSRSGKGLKIAIERALREAAPSAGLPKEALGYINAHGTATLFNDEMEAVAFHDLGLQDVPLNSMKGYFGHTLGAAGVVETITAIRQLNEGVLLKSLGYEKAGVSKNIHVLTQHTEAKDIQFAMKTSSGFGGCNAALIIEKA